MISLSGQGQLVKVGFYDTLLGNVHMMKNKYFQKVVGKRSFACGSGVEANDGFFRLVSALRGNKPFIPRGVYRFKTFEESDAWQIRMMARTSNHDRRL